MSRLIDRFTHLQFILISGITIALGLILFLPPSLAYAASPLITVGRYNPSIGCVDQILGSADIDTYTRDTMAGEVYSTWTYNALEANAVIIRTVAMHYYNTPQSSNGWCNNTGQYFTLNSYTWQGWQYWGHGATAEGISNNIPNDRVTDTGGQILKQNNGTTIPNLTVTYDCAQTYAQTLSMPPYNRTYIHILTDSDGVYGANRPTNLRSCAPTLNGLTGNSAYNFTSSMTNGTATSSLPGSTQSSSVTLAGQAREAEVFYGHARMDAVLNQPFNQPGQYISGYHLGDKVEYIMEAGGGYNYLFMVGIGDIPTDVVVNVYIDGYFKGTQRWNNNDNARHLNTTPHYVNIFGSKIVHRVAIEFANDAITCSPSSNPNCDRNFYLDQLAFTTTPP